MLTTDSGCVHAVRGDGGNGIRRGILVGMVDHRTAPRPISPREREVLALVAAHLTNAEIADRLVLSVRTVESHVSSLLRKLDVHDRRDLARQAAGAVRAQPAGRWPAEVTSFVGRAAERAALAAAVEAHRLVTVTGPGGVGKTRLSVEVARGLASLRRDGGRFVDLLRVSDPGLVVAAISRALDIPELPGGTSERALAAGVAQSDALIVLDNCEHVLDSVRACAELLLAASPSVHLLATSRARLGDPAEWVHRLSGLTVSDDGGDAVELFAQRAESAGSTTPPDPAEVGRLCRRLDGMALAIELAAARYPTLGLDGLVAGLDHSLQVLTGGAGEDKRHGSLRQAIAWSHDLLSDDQQRLLCAVSVFTAGFTLEAATAVSALPEVAVADGLGRLADHSLLVATPGTPTVYRALETIRQFAAEEAERRGVAQADRRRHGAWCLARLDALRSEVPDGPWCARLDTLGPDVAAAIAWASGTESATARELAQEFAALLILRGRPDAARRRYEQAAGHAGDLFDRARLLRSAAGSAAAHLDGDAALRLLDEAAAVALQVGDHGAAAHDLAWMVIYSRAAPGIIATLPTPEETEERVRRAEELAGGSPVARAAVAAARTTGLPDSDPAAAAAAARACDLARTAGAPLVLSVAIDQLTSCHLAGADLDGARETIRAREAVLGAQRLDATSAFQFNDHLLMGSEVNLAAGDLPGAADYAERLAQLPFFREQDHLAESRWIKVDAMAGALDRAAQRGERFLAGWVRAGRPRATTLASTTWALAMVHGLLGDDAARERWAAVTREIARGGAARNVDDASTGWAPTMDAIVALDRGEADRALERLSADVDDVSVWAYWHSGLWRPWYAAAWAEAAVLAGRPDAAERLERARTRAADNPVATAVVDRAAALLAGETSALPALATRLTRLGCTYQATRTLHLQGAG